MCRLSERLLQARSATQELEDWCLEHGIGDGTVVAVRAAGAVAEPLDAESVAALGDDRPGEAAFRRVQLASAGVVLVDALNWYFAGRLTAAMRAMLETEAPFGRVIAPLRPWRRTFLVRRCTEAEFAAGCPHIFEHRAVVLAADGAVLAVVHERFRRVLLD